MNFLLTIKKIRILLFFILIYCNITSTIKGEHYNSYITYLSKIIIKINSKGNQQIFSNSFSNFPDSVFINNNPIDYQRTRTLDLNESSNTIELIYNNDLTTCSKMFSKCNKIVEIDLSQFNGVSVKSYNYMFENCASLTLINLSNLDTSSSTDMS